MAAVQSATFARGRLLFRVVLAHERFCHSEDAPTRGGVSRSQDHADAFLALPRTRRLGKQLRDLDAERAGEAHQGFERWIRVRGGAPAQDALQAGNGLHGHASPRRELCLRQTGLEAQLPYMIGQSGRYVGHCVFADSRPLNRA
jgi:hypothetical protein